MEFNKSNGDGGDKFSHDVVSGDIKRATKALASTTSEEQQNEFYTVIKDNFQMYVVADCSFEEFKQDTLDYLTKQFSTNYKNIQAVTQLLLKIHTPPDSADKETLETAVMQRKYINSTIQMLTKNVQDGILNIGQWNKDNTFEYLQLPLTAFEELVKIQQQTDDGRKSNFDTILVSECIDMEPF